MTEQTTGVGCLQCGAKLRVEITGGNFYVRDGSTLENLNFEKAEDTSIITLDEPVKEEGSLDESTMFGVNIICSENPEHFILGHADTTIRTEIMKRLIHGAQRVLRNL